MILYAYVNDMYLFIYVYVDGRMDGRMDAWMDLVSFRMVCCESGSIGTCSGGPAKGHLDSFPGRALW